MKKGVLFATAILTFGLSPALAETIGWSMKTKTSRSWKISGTVTNGQLKMDGGSCETTSSTAKKVTGVCTYQTGYCRKGDRIKIRVLLGGDKPRVTAGGNCNGGRF